MKIIVFILSVFTLLSCETGAGSSARPTETVKKEGGIDPKAVILNDSAVSIMATNKQEAIRLLEEALGIQPNYFFAWHNKVGCQLSLGLTDDALLSLKKMEEIDPSLPDTKTNLGILLDITGDSIHAQEKYQEVETIYTTVLDTIHPQHNPYHMYEMLRASNLKLMGREEAANVLLLKLLSDPNVDTLYTSKAVEDLLEKTRNVMLREFKENVATR